MTNLHENATISNRSIASLTAKICMAARHHCPDVGLLAFLSELGELDDNGREQVLETAKVAYTDYNQRAEPLWDYGSYRD